MKLNIIPFKKAYRVPITYKRNSAHTRNGIYVCISDSYACGIGEIAPLPEISIETLHEATQATSSVADYISTLSSPTHIDDIKVMMLPLKNKPISVQFGIEMALVTLLLSKHSHSLSSYLNPNHNRTVNINALLHSNAQSSLDIINNQDYQCYKLKVGRHSINDDIDFVKTVMKQIPAHHSIKLDCNGLWSLEEALYFQSKLNPNQILYIEDPVSSIEDQRLFAANSSIPIALDEYYELETLTRYEHASYFIVKPMVKSTLLSLHSLPKSIQKKLVISSSYETEIGLLALIHLASSLGQTHSHGLDTLRYFLNTSFSTSGIVHLSDLPSFDSLIHNDWKPL